MKRRSPFHLSVLLMAALTFSLPFAQHTSVRAAQTKPIAQIDKSFGMNTGCLMPGMGTAPTQSVPRILFASQLLGKSPEYVTNYAQNPQTTTRNYWAFGGCMVAGVVVGVVVGLILFIVIVDAMLII